MVREKPFWQAGAAIRRFAAVAGTAMEGYIARTGPSTGTADELEIGALIIARLDKRLIMVTADVAAVDTALVDTIGARAGIERSELVVCASHTHSGPAGIVPNLHPSAPDKTNPILRESFIETCVATIRAALERIEPVELLLGSSETTGLAANRNDASGPFDRRASVLATRTRTGHLSAVLVHFACHPTILGAESRRISADFPGALRRTLGALLIDNSHTPAILYANGAAGDVSTRYTRVGQDFKEVERVGTGLATAASRALTTAQTIDGPIRYERKTVTVTPRSLDKDDNASSKPIDDDSTPLTGPEHRRIETRKQGDALLSGLMARGQHQVHSTFNIEAWSLGELTFVAVPGEFFASLGRCITDTLSSPIIVLGYANGYVGYLADEDAYLDGTYEALASPFASGAGERVAKAARQLCQRFRGPALVEPGDT